MNTFPIRNHHQRVPFAGTTTMRGLPPDDVASDSLLTVISLSWLPLPAQGFVLHVIAAEELAVGLRHAVASACGEKLRFLRIEPMGRSHWVKVWICLTTADVSLAMDAISNTLPASDSDSNRMTIHQTPPRQGIA